MPSPRGWPLGWRASGEAAPEGASAARRAVAGCGPPGPRFHEPGAQLAKPDFRAVALPGGPGRRGASG